MSVFSIDFAIRIAILSIMMILVWHTMTQQSISIKENQQMSKMKDSAEYLDSEINNIMISLQKLNSSLNKSIHLPQDYNYYYKINLSCVGGNIWIMAETEDIGKTFIIKKHIKCSTGTVSGDVYPGKNCIVAKRIEDWLGNIYVNLSLEGDCIGT